MNEIEILPAPELNLPKPENDKFHVEQRAFYRLLPELLRTQRGQYVAIHNEQVVESGIDLVEVAARAYAKHGYVPIYVDLVEEHPLPPIRMPSPRRVRETSS